MSHHPDLDLAVDTLVDYFGSLLPVWEWKWRGVPFGPCPRCHWPANTLAPNGSPFHAFCWGDPNPPPSFDQWLLRKVREQERES